MSTLHEDSTCGALESPADHPLVHSPELFARQRKAQSRARVLDGRFEPIRVGRFSVLHKLGEGAMGLVYAAYDQELDRKVALKFLHPSRSDDDQAIHRMVREAQALARVSHPHLIAVFEVGRFEGLVYLAMELVAGATMRAWIEQPRPWPLVLRHWCSVAAALTAVHDAALVHRDIKPDNVLVGDDGRARLVDFGLARGASQHASESTAAPANQPPGAKLSQVVTQTNAAVGTPAYMAPEARLGDPAGPAADQYSLCVSLYESLYGRRPAAPTRDGAQVDVPEGRAVPTATRRALSRGLAEAAEDRFPSVAALRRALERPLGQRRRRAALGIGLAAIVVSAGLGGVMTHAMTSDTVAHDPCARTGQDIAQVWSPQRRDAVRSAIEATALPHALQLADRVDAQFDAFALGWARTRRHVCQATHVERVQSGAQLDRRMLCLDRHRLQATSMLDALSSARDSHAAVIAAAVSRLPNPDDCALPGLAQSTLTAAPPEQRAEANELRGELASLSVGMTFDPMQEVLPKMEKSLLKAEALGYWPLVAEASLLLGRARAKRLDLQEARAHLERADNLAEAHTDLLLKARVRRVLVRLTVDAGSDTDGAWRALARYEATLDALGSRARHRTEATAARALVQRLAGDLDGAVASLRQAISETERLHAPGTQGDLAVGALDSGSLAGLWMNLAMVLYAQGSTDASLEASARAHELDARWGLHLLDLRGQRHWPGKADSIEGSALVDAGQRERARKLLNEVLATQQHTYGKGSLPVALTHVALADLAMRTADIARAEVHAEAADTIMLRWLDPRHELRAGPLSALGLVAYERGDHEAALKAFTLMLEIERATRPAGGLDIAVADSNVGEALLALGRGAEAQPHLERALVGMRAHLDPRHPNLGFPLKALAELHLAAGRPDDAAPMLQEALALHEHTKGLPLEHARTLWALARVRAAQKRHAESRRLANDAHARLIEISTDLGNDVDVETDTIAAWLATSAP